jgi:hypothetical protein
MTRRSIKQEKPHVEEVEEEVTMSSPWRKGKYRAPTVEDEDMAEAPMASANSFTAMPTPSSFAMDSGVDTPIDGLRRESTAGELKEIPGRFILKIY